MIAFLRHLVTHDLGLKLFALALAVLIWTTVHAILEEGGNPLSTQPKRTFADLPVWVAAPPDDARAFRPQPAQVNVTVRGEQEVLDQLGANDIHVTVVLTEAAAARHLLQHVDVATPPGVTLVRVSPAEVEVVVQPQ